jgi:replicative DNA helicase
MNAPDRHVDERGLVVPPQAIEAEQSVLGALMLDNDAVDRIPELRAEHFYRYDHRVIFEHITRMIMAGRRADVITTYEALGTSGKDEQIGGLSYLNALAQNVPGSAGIRRYAEIVIERAQLRGILCATAPARPHRKSSPKPRSDSNRWPRRAASSRRKSARSSRPSSKRSTRDITAPS